MFADGFVDEVRRLASWLGPTASLAVGYREVLEVVEGRRSEAEALSAAKRATVALAKRQRTFSAEIRGYDGSHGTIVASSERSPP